tara:strand:- start:944 stop:2254 length:1311 start_codon:yes stop_codon:yes gene_type:complete
MQITLSGAKNSVLPLLAIPCLSSSEIHYVNVPGISDVDIMCELLEVLQFQIIRETNKIIILPHTLFLENNFRLQSTASIRASYYFFGTLVHFKTKIIHPSIGGCNLGDRNIDFHQRFFELLGVHIIMQEDAVIVDATNFCFRKSTSYTFPKKTVGGTINAIFAGVVGEGEIYLYNHSKDMYVFDVIEVLSALGAEISVHDSHIYMKRQSHLKTAKVVYEIKVDPVNTGTAILFAALSESSEAHFHNANLSWLGETKEILSRCGINMVDKAIVRTPRLKEFHITTDHYPGFYTDLMPLFCILASQIGNCSIEEKIYNNRFQFVHELKKLDFNFQLINNKKIQISHCNFGFDGNSIGLSAPDLRGGVALVLASCLTIKNFPEKQIVIKNFHYLRRGCDNIEIFTDLFQVRITNRTDNIAILRHKDVSKPISLHSGSNV